VFYEQGVSGTARRNGVLLLVSFFEHQAVVLPDLSVVENIAAEKWQHLIGQLTIGIKAGKLKESIIQAIRECGDLLEESGFKGGEDEGNELPDNLIVD
jgi:putative membrane protein